MGWRREIEVSAGDLGDKFCTGGPGERGPLSKVAVGGVVSNVDRGQVLYKYPYGAGTFGVQALTMGITGILPRFWRAWTLDRPLSASYFPCLNWPAAASLNTSMIDIKRCDWINLDRSGMTE